LEEEEDQWKKVSYRYEEYSKRFSQVMDKRLAETEAAAAGMSEKMRGKQRMIEREEDLEDMLPDSRDLPADLRRSLDLTRTVLLSSSSQPSTSRRSSSRHARATEILTTHRGTSITRQELAAEIEELIPSVGYKLDKLHSFVNAARMTTKVAEEMLDERFRLLVGNLERRRPDSGNGDVGGGSGVGEVIQKEVAPLYVRDATPSTSQGRGENVGKGGGLMDLMRALSHIDTVRHPSKIGDSVRRAAREVQRIGEEGGGGPGERRLTAVYPAGILSSGAGGGGSVVMTPRKTPRTPKRYGTPGRERERTPGR
jgi:kinetochore protein Mis13/DSN1